MEDFLKIIFIIFLFLIICVHENAINFLNKRIIKLEINQEVKQIQDLKTN